MSRVILAVCALSLFGCADVDQSRADNVPMTTPPDNSRFHVYAPLQDTPSSYRRTHEVVDDPRTPNQTFPKGDPFNQY